MSVRASSWAWSITLPATQKLVLLALADHSNDEDFSCWPSVTHLTKKTGLGRRTVFTVLDQLSESGLIHRTAREGRQTTLYTLRVDSAGTASVQEQHQCESGTNAGAALTGARTAPPLVRERHMESSVEPSKNHQISTPTGVEGDGSPPPCPHQEIIKAYHEILPECPQVREWNKTRQGYLQTRWREKTERQSVSWWKKFFGYIAKSSFLTGHVDGRDGQPPFRADLEWIIKPNNFAKIIEGRYHREAA